MTIGGSVIPDRPDLVRMRRDRHAKLQEQLDAHRLAGLVLFGTNNVTYATGARAPAMDSGEAALLRQFAVVVRDDPAPHLFTPFADAAPPDLPADHVHVGLEPRPRPLDLFPPGARVGVDELTPTTSGLDCVGASVALGPAKLTKTVDELACIRTAQQVNELAMRTVQRELAPGLRQTDLTATFLRRIFELGASSNAIDPIWQVMPMSKAEGPWTVHGDVAFPTPTSGRLLADGDVVWVDTGIVYEGYASDFGRTWIVGDREPTTRQQAQYERWRSVVDAVLACCRPGATGADLTSAAIATNGGTKPWLEHFYLVHGVGTDSAEMPLIGTDLGQSFDEQLVLTPGMVLVIEPVIWDDGEAGYRSEDIYAVTDDGWAALSDYPFVPFHEA
jgi:Xaa-Pro aminopeptidase